MFKRRLLAMCILCAFKLVALPTNASAEEQLRTLLSQLSNNSQKTNSGTFSQSRFMSVLDEPLVSNGRYALLDGGVLQWHILSPFEISYAYDGSTLTQTEFGESHVITLKDDPMLIGFFSFFHEIMQGNTQALDNLFEITVNRASKGEINTQLLLRPKKAFLKKSFKEVRIDLSGDALAKIDIIESVSDKVSLSFSNTPSQRSSP